MLITFDTDGSVQHTRNPALEGLVPAGHKQIVRMTDILFDDQAQLFYIQFVTGKFAESHIMWRGRRELVERWREFYNHHSAALCRELVVPNEQTREFRSLAYFRTYEDAVAIEIAFVDYLREQGISMI